jgi:hypothetical protein
MSMRYKREVREKACPKGKTTGIGREAHLKY